MMSVHPDADRTTMPMMRTTIDLPEDVHRILTAVARDRGQTLSQTVSDMLRKTLTPDEDPQVYVDTRTGLPAVHFGHIVTSEDVKALEDEA